ncbi:MAG: FtsX-like permease family protein [Spirochaetales bacterium]
MGGLAFRNLTRQFRRYGVLMATLVFGFAVVMLVLGLTSGMTRSLERKAARYFAGDLSITGYSKAAYESIDDQKEVLAAIARSGIPTLGVARRTNYNSLDATLFFNGSSVRQRRLVGVDWTLEAPNFADMDFVSGGLQGMAGSEGILVSTQVASKTGVRAGDQILLLMSTRGGAQNTANLVVKGVYRESSFFGSTAYLDIETLNRLYGQAPGSATDMGVMLAPGISPTWADERLRAALVAKKLQVFGPIDTREAQIQAFTESWEGRKYAVMTLRAHLSVIADVLDAVNVVTAFVLVFFLVIIVVGVSNTYRMIVRERVTEIGTLRALGMQAGAVRSLFLREAVLLAVGGIGGGLLVGLLFLWGATAIDLSGYGALLMFLKQGRPDWYLEPVWLLASFAVMFASCLLGVWGPARSAARMRPVDALADKG